MPAFFRPARPLLLGWLIALVGWSVVALVVAAEGVATRGDRWTMHFWLGLRTWLPWALWTPLIFRLAGRLPLERSSGWWALPAHLVAAALVIGSIQGWKILLPRGEFGGGPPRQSTFGPPNFDDDFRPGPPGGDRRDRFPGPPPDFRLSVLHFVTGEIPLYTALLAGAHALAFFRRDKEREAHLVQARLEVLRTQLQPHFLFNTLNTIAGLIPEDPARAEGLVESLSELLRVSLEKNDRPFAPLEDEVDFVERYLVLMHARFEERLRYAIELDDALRAVEVPVMLIHPLVENAVEHGLQPKPEGGLVTLRVRRRGEALQIEVTDDGVGLGDGPLVEGIGLGNTRKRLLELYGATASLTLQRLSPGTRLLVELPLRLPA